VTPQRLKILNHQRQVDGVAIDDGGPGRSGSALIEYDQAMMVVEQIDEALQIRGRKSWPAGKDD